MLANQYEECNQWNRREDSLVLNVTFNTQLKLGVETLLLEALHEYMDSWNNPAVWSRIWSEISEEASKVGITAYEARKVARRLFHQLNEELNVKKAEVERKERQRKIHDNALALWVKNLDFSDKGVEWNYDMWDEFLGTLNAPVDMSYLEQTRDAFIKEAIIGLQEKKDKAAEKWGLGLTVTPQGYFQFTPVVGSGFESLGKIWCRALRLAICVTSRERGRQNSQL